jgi:hypothetical protein
MQQKIVLDIFQPFWNKGNCFSHRISKSKRKIFVMLSSYEIMSDNDGFWTSLLFLIDQTTVHFVATFKRMQITEHQKFSDHLIVSNFPCE